MLKLIFVCLVCCCSSIMPLRQSESIVHRDYTQCVVEKTKKNYVQTSSGYYEYGTSDLFAYDFLVGLINYYTNDLGVVDVSYSSNNPVNNYVIQTNNVYECFWYDSPHKLYYPLFRVSNIIINKSIEGNSSDSFPVLHYNFIFSNASPYNYQISIDWIAQRTNDMRLTIWGVAMSLPTGSIDIYRQNYSGILVTVSNVQLVYPVFMLSERIDGYNSFIGNVWNTIHSDPFNNGYNTGYSQGLIDGYESVVSNPQNNGYQTIYNNGYQNGYSNGYNEALDTDSTALTIFTGFVNVGLLPVNVFLQMFNYEVFGINIAGLLTSIITIAIMVIIIRVVTGKKND